MAKVLSIIFIIFFSIAGICIYKWIAIYLKIRKMIPIKCKVTDIRNITTFEENIYDYHYVYKYNGKEYKICDSLLFNELWQKHIGDELKMYIDEKDPTSFVSPWQTYLYKLYIIIILASLIIPFILSL